MREERAVAVRPGRGTLEGMMNRNDDDAESGDAADHEAGAQLRREER
ncbi:MAG: hypothetical protein ACI89G_002880 [Minisyncoccia bacterium]|jgi:hypothetical protein